MKNKYKTGKEYNLFEILQYNLRMWWLAAILAVIFAALLGGYKVVTLKPYVENEVYQDKMQVKAALYVTQFNDSSVIERGNDIMKIASSNRTYEAFKSYTKNEITFDEYKNLFEAEQSENSSVVTFYVTFPDTEGNFTIADETDGMDFMNGLVAAIESVSGELTGQSAVHVLDEPYAIKEIEKMVSYSISSSDYKKAIVKALTAGILLGIIIEVALYTLWMLLYKKPKNADEIRECLDSNIIDVFKKDSENCEIYKKAALYLKGNEGCNIINCMPIHCKTDDALKIAMCYANEQKRTLYIDMADNNDLTYSLSGYLMGKRDTVDVEKLNDHLFAVHRSLSMEDGFDAAGSGRMSEYLENMRKEYEYIVIADRSIGKAAEGYYLAKLADKNVLLCGRKNTRNEQLYDIRNTARINEIEIDGVLVYDL